jgi:hypothetical protein
MIDINTILTQALAAAVAEATKPLVERIAALEAKLAEAAPALLAERVTALEESKGMTAAAFVTYLDGQEWFWEEVSRYITNNSDITVDELHNIKQRLGDAEAAIKAHEDNVYHYDKGAVETLIETAIENHEEGMSHYDEDDIDTKIDNAIERHEENRTHGDDDDIEEIVQKLLNSASISITV